MAQLHGDKDEQFAAGTIVGGTASLFGGPVAAAKIAGFATAKLGALGALQLGIKVAAFFTNPFIASAFVIGGAGYLICKGRKQN
jgi:hypothetical protein